MEKAIEFFLQRAKLNYILLFLIVAVSIYSYVVNTKEVFPPFQTGNLKISGSYSGSSAKVMDKTIVSLIEDEINNMEEISTYYSSIRSGRFSIRVKTKDGTDLDKFKIDLEEALDGLNSKFPQDFDDPKVSISRRDLQLLFLQISSKDGDKFKINKDLDAIKRNFSKIPGIAEIKEFGVLEQEFKVKVDLEKIQAYGFAPSEIIAALKNSFFTSSMGYIESDEKSYISVDLSQDMLTKIKNSTIKINGQILDFADIASITRQVRKPNVISLSNGKQKVTLRFAKSDDGDAIELSQKVHNIVKRLEKRYPNLIFSIRSDTSKFVERRLNTVTANIFFSFILVVLSLAVFINFPTSLLAAIGIPVSFGIGLSILYSFDLSINIISLIGLLVVVGIVVDDTIIVAENIQRHITMGKSPYQAALDGTKEVVAPVLAAAFTTFFAFLPMFLISGDLGHFIKYLPLTIIIVTLASLLECFIFLPHHATDFLKKGAKEFNFEPLKKAYIGLLAKVVHHKIISLAVFFLVIPGLIAYSISKAQFQLFSEFDADELFIAGKVANNDDLYKTLAIVNDLNAEILKHKDELSIKQISTTVGGGFDAAGRFAVSKDLFHFNIELHTLKPTDWFNVHVVPMLLFFKDYETGIRTLAAGTIKDKLNQYLKDAKNKYNLENFEIIGAKTGVVENDISVSFVSKDEAKLDQAARQVKKALENIEGVYNIRFNADDGPSEIKIVLNRYGKSLGLNEQYVANAVRQYFFDNEINTLDDKDFVDIQFESLDKSHIAQLEDFLITLPGGQFVSFKEIADIKVISGIKKISKRDGLQRRKVAASVKKEITTPLAVNEVLDPLITDIKKELGVKGFIAGERERVQKLKGEMVIAAIIAFSSMMIILMMLFNSFILSFMALSVIPLSLLGVFLGHEIVGERISMLSLIGAVGLAGIVINDGIVMLDFLRKNADPARIFQTAALRFRPVVLTSITTFLGLSTMIFFAFGQAALMKPLAISLGFGLLWGTVLNLLYLPLLFNLLRKFIIKDQTP